MYVKKFTSFCQVLKRCTRKKTGSFLSVSRRTNTHTHTHTHPFNGPFSRTTRVSRYQKGKTNLDFTVARDSEWQWHPLGHMQVCTSLQTENHASNPPLSFLQAGCPSCRPTNSVKALKGYGVETSRHIGWLTERACVRACDILVPTLWRGCWCCLLQCLSRANRDCCSRTC